MTNNRGTPLVQKDEEAIYMIQVETWHDNFVGIPILMLLRRRACAKDGVWKRRMNGGCVHQGVEDGNVLQRVKMEQRCVNFGNMEMTGVPVFVIARA